MGYVVASVGDSSNNFPYTAFYSRKSYIDKNENLLKDFSKALQKGISYTLNNDAKDIAKVVKNQFEDTSLEDLETIINRYKKADVWLSTPYIDEELYNTLNNLLVNNNLLKESVPYNNLINNLYE